MAHPDCKEPCESSSPHRAPKLVVADVNVAGVQEATAKFDATAASTPEQKCIGRPAQKCVTGSEATEGVLSGTDGGLLGRAERSSPIAA